jgi:hypothetical protein
MVIADDATNTFDANILRTVSIDEFGEYSGTPRSLFLG